MSYYARTYPEGNIPLSDDSEQILLTKITNLLGGSGTAAPITPSNTVDLTTATTRGIFVGGTGDIKIDLLDGTTATFPGVPVGIFPVNAKRVYATGTTATNLIALY